MSQTKSKIPAKAGSSEESLAVVKEKIGGLRNLLETTSITNDEELKVVADKIKQVKLFEKFVTQEKEKYVAPAKEIIEKAREQYDPFIKECRNAEITLKDRAKKYMLDRDAKIQEDKDKLASRVERGTMKAETAVRKMEALPETQNTVKSETGSRLQISKRKVAEFDQQIQTNLLRRVLEIGFQAMKTSYEGEFAEVKENLIPLEYWMVDDVKVRREALDRNKNNLPSISGVVIREEVDLSSI